MYVMNPYPPESGGQGGNIVCLKTPHTSQQSEPTLDPPTPSYYYNNIVTTIIFN